MKKVIFCWACLLVAIATQAQDLTAGIRYIKVANTLREVGQYDEAEKFLAKGLPIVQGRDTYWEAVAHENYGLMYRDQEQRIDAARSFQRAIALYARLDLKVSLRAIEQLLMSVSGKEELYAGIDIGAKGVKLSLVHVSVKPPEGLTSRYQSVLSLNVKPSALTPQAIRETAEAVKTLLDTATARRNVPADRLFLVISSGLKQAMDRQPGKEAELVAAIRTALNDQNRPIEVIVAVDEAKLSFLSLTNPRYYQAFSLMDIGSGNVKGGAMLRARQFEPILFEYGVETLVQKIRDMEPNADISGFARNTTKAMVAIKKEIAGEMNRKAGAKTRPTVIFNGGIVFAMMTLLHPERAKELRNEFTADDVQRFATMSGTRFEELIHPDLSPITDPAIRKTAEADVQAVVTRIFPQQEAFIAGSAMFNALVQEYNRGSAKRFVFYRGADVAWVSGYVFKLIQDDYARRTDK